MSNLPIFHSEFFEIRIFRIEISDYLISNFPILISNYPIFWSRIIRFFEAELSSNYPIFFDVEFSLFDDEFSLFLMSYFPFFDVEFTKFLNWIFPFFDVEVSKFFDVEFFGIHGIAYHESEIAAIGGDWWHLRRGWRLRGRRWRCLPTGTNFNIVAVILQTKWLTYRLANVRNDGTFDGVQPAVQNNP